MNLTSSIQTNRQGSPALQIKTEPSLPIKLVENFNGFHFCIFLNPILQDKKTKFIHPGFVTFHATPNPKAAKTTTKRPPPPPPPPPQPTHSPLTRLSFPLKTPTNFFLQTVAVMLHRAFTTPRKSPKSPKDVDGSSRSQSIDEYEDCIVGLTDDLPLNFCYQLNCVSFGGTLPTLREVLRSSVGVIGESRLGMSEKVVLSAGKVFTAKRFRKVSVRKREFGRRVERLSQIGRCCKYLVPVTAYLYEKRTKFVLCDYFPMGSLADLLAGGRERGHRALDWNQRLMMVLDIARAIAFIHGQSPTPEKNLQMNVHGNIKTSNIMINIDFSACLSDYGFTQLAERVEEDSNTLQQTPPPPLPENPYCNRVCQKCDIYNFGIVILDMLGGALDTGRIHCITENKEKIKDGVVQFFEFSVEGKARKQAVQVLEIALACTNRSPVPRPTMENILSNIENVSNNI